jgi:NAD(P)-dependent dehydrogenase (short-subunit alcohol dehydrogenase family)
MKMPALFDLTRRVAVVTGGNGGIGRGIALGLAEAGAAVAVFGRNDEKNHRVLSELKAIGVPSLALKVDVTNRAGLAPALKKVESELGDISILVNNAGIAVPCALRCCSLFLGMKKSRGWVLFIPLAASGGQRKLPTPLHGFSRTNRHITPASR